MYDNLPPSVSNVFHVFINNIMNNLYVNFCKHLFISLEVEFQFLEVTLILRGRIPEKKRGYIFFKTYYYQICLQMTLSPAVHISYF